MACINSFKKVRRGKLKKIYLKKTGVLAMTLVMMTGLLQGCGNETTGNEQQDQQAVESGAEAQNSETTETAETSEDKSEEGSEAKEEGQEENTETVEAAGADSPEYQAAEYQLVFEDEFECDSLNTDDRNVELHEPGWVNAELQRYSALDEGNLEVSDGTLKIKPHYDATTEEITSCRITTQNKHDFTYGRFEARAKVPTGKGYLPAFWLMATDEGLYGQWPKCGEIDIMEVMGQDTSKSYHTIHYGYGADKHKENQGTRTIEANGYSDDFHTYRVDWDPGKITWYVDDEEVYTTGDWHTGTDDDNQITYPAPFDQNFYVILNLAVGGNWVGYPGDAEKQEMNDKNFEIDYVKVWQKSADAYAKAESEATRPVREDEVFRDPDAEGNYVNDVEFKNEVGVDGGQKADKYGWKMHIEADGFGVKYEAEDGALTITPKNPGGQFYSVQLKQDHIPIYRGWEYELSFDAYSTEDRTIIVDIEGPDKGWIRYFDDTTVDIGTTNQTYTFNFTMNQKSDPNGSLEFNLGQNKSKAPVTISNVKLTHKSGEEITDGGDKTIRPDGNFVYNGTFDQGEKRLGYWEIADENKEYVSVTNKNNVRELKVEVPEDGKAVTLRESNLSPLTKGEYEVSFNARSEGANDGLTVKVSGKEYSPELTADDAKFSEKVAFDSDNTKEDSYIELVFDKKGTYYLDNLFVSEAALIKNGSFNAGITGFNPYIYDGVTANYVIDSMNGNDNAFAITINDTKADDNANAWYVQLNQDGITLEEGKTYRLTFKAKSTIDRAIAYSLQEYEGEWTNYSGNADETVNIGSDWTTFTKEFKMEYPTDTNTRFNITLGSVGGKRITDKHDVFIDDISLEVVE